MPPLPWLLAGALALVAAVLLLALLVWRQRAQAERRARNPRALFEGSRP